MSKFQITLARISRSSALARLKEQMSAGLTTCYKSAWSRTKNVLLSNAISRPEREGLKGSFGVASKPRVVQPPFGVELFDHRKMIRVVVHCPLPYIEAGL